MKDQLASKIITREQQQKENTWKLEDLFETEEDYAREVQLLTRQMEAFAGLSGTLEHVMEAAHGDAGDDVRTTEKPSGASPAEEPSGVSPEEEPSGALPAGHSSGRAPAEQLLAVLSEYEAMSLRFERIYVYAQQRYHEDTADGKRQSQNGESQILSVKFSQATAWLEPELLALPQECLDAAMEEECLVGYRRFVAQITRRRTHVLDAKTEELLARAGELGGAPSNIFSMFNNADARFPDAVDANGQKVPVTVGRYISYMESNDRVLRKSAFESLYSVYGQYSNTLAAMYYANAKQADFFAKERRYTNAMEEALDASAIPTEVYTNLVAAVNEALPLMHRYVRLRRKLLGVSELHMYDVYVPIAGGKILEKRYSFEEAKELVLQGLAPLGETYQALLREGFENRWIDVYENQGKRTGAYSWGAYGTHPYVLLNYHGTLGDVFTLAHEMGHALHSWHSDHTQSYLNAGYRIFVAEVASTCNEALLIHFLLNQTQDAEEKKYLINYFLDQFKGTMFRQTMFAEFEMVTHGIVEKGGTLTAESICQTYLDLNRRYFGADMISDEQIQYEWARIPHFYTPFYVYQYATGFAAAIAISSKILAETSVGASGAVMSRQKAESSSEEGGMVGSYMRFLSGGCSQDPIDLLRICGVDMASPEPVRQALAVFETYLDELEQLCEKSS